MAGLCGVVGECTNGIDELLGGLLITGDEAVTATEFERLRIGYADHEFEFDEQPATTSDGSKLWIWGSILGHEYKGEYTPRTFEKSDAAYCADLYDKYGLNFVVGLNSEFSGLVYDPETETVSIFTDRLGRRPVYYTSGDDGGLIFAPLISALGKHPDIELSIDETLVGEFLAYGRVFGVHTPVEDVRALPPGSVTTFDLDGKKTDSWTYWWPNPSPRALPQSAFVDRFIEVFHDAVDERRAKGGDCGLLLSGGTDSRVLLDALDGDVTAFHMNERLEENREARTAREVAEIAGAEFEFLQRDIDYYPSVLEQSGPLINFNGRFDHMHTLGFTQELKRQSTVLFSGHYGDTILTAHHVPRADYDGRISRRLLPRRTPITVSTAAEFMNVFGYRRIRGGQRKPDFLTTPVEPISVVESHLNETPESVEFHGVSYSSWDSLLQYGMIYSISNTYSFSFYESLLHTIPTRTPFLDNRLVDLSLEMSIENRWEDIVSTAVGKMNPELAAVPHPSTGISPKAPPWMKFYAIKSKSALAKVAGKFGRKTPADTLTRVDAGGPWPDFDEQLRMEPFACKQFKYNKELINQLTFVDYNELIDCFETQTEGSSNWRELFAVLTLLEFEN